MGLPGCGATITLSFDEPITRVDPLTGTAVNSSFAAATGPRTTPASIRSAAREWGVAIELAPTRLRELFGLDASSLAAQPVSLSDVVGWSESLVDELHEQTTTRERAAVLDAVLGRVMNSDCGIDPRWHTAYEMISDPHGPSVASVADYVGSSRQHLTRQMQSLAGLDPSTLRRLARFERSASLLAVMPTAQVAQSCGYSDQSHMIRDWNNLAGCTPAQWSRHEPDSVRLHNRATTDT